MQILFSIRRQCANGSEKTFAHNKDFISPGGYSLICSLKKKQKTTFNIYPKYLRNKYKTVSQVIFDLLTGVSESL